LVPNTLSGRGMRYYQGFFAPTMNHRIWYPVNTDNVDEALQLKCRDQAQRICDTINSLDRHIAPYHVEDRIYLIPGPVPPLDINKDLNGDEPFPWLESEY
jgi:hypothetical protein